MSLIRHWFCFKRILNKFLSMVFKACTSVHGYDWYNGGCFRVAFVFVFLWKPLCTALRRTNDIVDDHVFHRKVSFQLRSHRQSVPFSHQPRCWVCVFLLVFYYSALWFSFRRSNPLYVITHSCYFTYTAKTWVTGMYETVIDQPHLNLTMINRRLVDTGKSANCFRNHSIWIMKA